ncbi:hypothetical protein ABPG72_007435 [Tetrahymena utriculariae]
MQKAENEQNDMLPFMDDEGELAKKCLSNIDSWMKEEDVEFFNKCLKKLGLCERKGLDGQIMLYPVKSKERKLEKEEFQEMMSRLYTVKAHHNQFSHLNRAAIEEIEKQKQSSKKMNSVYKQYSKSVQNSKMSRAKEGNNTRQKQSKLDNQSALY